MADMVGVESLTGVTNRFIKEITDPQYKTPSYYAGPTVFNAL